jgi:hypothetical protein
MDRNPKQTYQCVTVHSNATESVMTAVKQMSLSAVLSPKCTFRIKSALVPVGSDGSSYLINIDDTSVN